MLASIVYNKTITTQQGNKMSKLLKDTIIKTVEEMIVIDGDMEWIRGEVEYMFEQEFSNQEWRDITLQALARQCGIQPALER